MITLFLIESSAYKMRAMIYCRTTVVSCSVLQKSDPYWLQFGVKPCLILDKNKSLRCRFDIPNYTKGGYVNCHRMLLSLSFPAHKLTFWSRNFTFKF